MTTNHSDQGFISNRGASDRLFPAHLLNSFIHHRMLGSHKPEDDFVTRVKTIPLKSWQTANQHRTSRGNLCPGCQYRRIGLRRSFCRPPTDHHLQSATAITVPSLARENNNSPPARTAAADAAIYCIYNAIKIRAYNEHFRVKYDIVVGLTSIYIKKKLCHIGP